MGRIGLDDLRSILLSERETGRLTAVAPDIFEKGVAELGSITKKVYAFEDPFSDDARSLIDETLSIRETLQDLFAIRSRKIVALTIMHAEGSYYDREEVCREGDVRTDNCQYRAMPGNPVTQYPSYASCSPSYGCG